MKKIFIYGIGGAGRSILRLINDINEINKVWEIVGIVGNSSKMIGKIIDGYNVFKYDQLPKYKNAYGICGMMDPVVKKKLLIHRLKKINTKYQL